MASINRLFSYLTKKLGIDIHYFARGGFWLLLTQAITITGSLIGTVIFANVLTEANYGMYRYLIALTVLFSTFSLTGISQSIFQTAAKNHTEFFPFGIKVSLLYSLGITVTGIIGAGYYFLNDNSTLALGCLFIAVLQPLINAYQNIIPFLQGLRLFKKSALLQVFRVMFLTTVSVVTVYITHNVLILLIVFLLAQVIGNILSSLLFRNRVTSKTVLTEDVRIKYLHYAQHTSIQNIIIGVATRLDSVLVFQQLGAANLAIYSIAILVPDQIKGTCKNILPLLIPKLSKYQTLEETRLRMPKKSIQAFFILLICSGLLMLILPSLYTVLFPKYPEAIIYSQLLLLALPTSIYLIPFSGLQTQLRNKELYAMNIYSALFHITISFSLIYTYGLPGAILSRIITQYIHMSLTFFLMFRAK